MTRFSQRFHSGQAPRLRRFAGRAGMTVLEVTIAMTIVSTVLLASAGAFLSSSVAVHGAQRTSQSAVFLETVMENLSAQDYADLTNFNGNRIYDGNSAGLSNYAADVTVIQSTVNLRQVQVLLTDLRSNKQIGRVTTLRFNR
jgi:type II secretory pathway pseudopilin PulG